MIVAAFTTVPAPWGLLHIAATARGIAAMGPETDTASFSAGLARRLKGTVVPDGPAAPAAMRELLQLARDELAGYLDGSRRAFEVPLDLEGLTEWERRVLEGARSIHYGEVASYGGLAAAIGSPRAARAVGNALARNPIALAIPCHRIIAGDGTLGGYGGTAAEDREAALAVKRMLLELEGVRLAAQPRGASARRTVRTGPASGTVTSRTRRPRSAGVGPR